MKRAILIAALVFAAGVPAAFAYTSPGSPTGYVNDFAGVVTPAAKQSLEAELSSFEKSTSNEITVVTVPNMGGDYIENYAVKLFAEWGVGKKNTDNGVLLLLSIEERKMRIEVGYGLEGALPDSVAQSILNNEMTPLLKQGDYDGAVTAGVRAIMQATKGEYVGTTSSGSLSGRDWESLMQGLVVIGFVVLQIAAAILGRSKSWWGGGVLGLAGGLGVVWYFALGLLFALPVVVLLIVIGLVFDYVVSQGYASAVARGVPAPWWFGGSGGRGGGGGFGGFGGGGSGGGGASGGW